MYSPAAEMIGISVGAHDDVPLAVTLHVEERIPDRDRNLVPELRGADRVRVHDHVGHARTLPVR